jgi:hypothetical protein
MPGAILRPVPSTAQRNLPSRLLRSCKEEKMYGDVVDVKPLENLNFFVRFADGNDK